MINFDEFIGPPPSSEDASSSSEEWVTYYQDATIVSIGFIKEQFQNSKEVVAGVEEGEGFVVMTGIVDKVMNAIPRPSSGSSSIDDAWIAYFQCINNINITTLLHPLLLRMHADPGLRDAIMKFCTSRFGGYLSSTNIMDIIADMMENGTITIDDGFVLVGTNNDNNDKSNLKRPRGPEDSTSISSSNGNNNDDHDDDDSTTDDDHVSTVSTPSTIVDFSQLEAQYHTMFNMISPPARTPTNTRPVSPEEVQSRLLAAPTTTSTSRCHEEEPRIPFATATGTSTYHDIPAPLPDDPPEVHELYRQAVKGQSNLDVIKSKIGSGATPEEVLRTIEKLEPFETTTSNNNNNSSSSCSSNNNNNDDGFYDEFNSYWKNSQTSFLNHQTACFQHNMRLLATKYGLDPPPFNNFPGYNFNDYDFSN